MASPTQTIKQILDFYTRHTISETVVFVDVVVDVDVGEDMGMVDSINERPPRPPKSVLSNLFKMWSSS